MSSYLLSAGGQWLTSLQAKMYLNTANSIFHWGDVGKPYTTSALQRAGLFCKHVDGQQESWAQANVPGISFISWKN